MGVNYTDFLSLACDDTSGDDVSEIKLRSAASRAYYALYHRACERMRELGLDIERSENAGSHQSLIDSIRRISPKAKSFAVSMDGIKRFRHTCDYDLRSGVPKSRVLKHIEETKRLLDMLDRIELAPVSTLNVVEKA